MERLSKWMKDLMPKAASKPKTPLAQAKTAIVGPSGSTPMVYGNPNARNIYLNQVERELNYQSKKK